MTKEPLLILRNVPKCLLLFAAVLTLSAATNWAVHGTQLTQRDSGYRKLTEPEIRLLFEDLHLANYPDDGSGGSSANWAMTFNANGSFDGNEFSNSDNGYGTWRVDGDQQCVTVDTVHYSNFGEGAEPLSGCFEVFVKQKGGVIAFGDPRNLGQMIILEDGAYSEIARLESVRQVKPPVPEPQVPAAAPSQFATREVESPEREKPAPKVKSSERETPAPKVRNETVERQRLALERQRLAEETKLKEMRLQLERDRIEQELALQRQKLDMQRQALILERRKRGLNTAQNLAPPAIRTAEKLQTTAKTVTIDGLVSDDSALVRVEVNGDAVRFGSEDGRFSKEVAVKLGKSEVRVAAFDVDGNRSEKTIVVTRSRDIPNVEFGTYHALVIGINDYEALPALKTAVADARAVAQTLKSKYGFEVTLLLNPSRDDIIDAFDSLRDELTEQDNLIIYYAGHGWLDEQSGRGYWLPVDARKDRRSRWLANSSLTDTLQAVFAKHVMVIADSCYSGTLTRSIKVPDRRSGYIAHMAEKRARVVLSSGGLEPVLDSGGGKHSVFAAQFLKALKENEGVIDGTQLFEKIRHTVVLNAEQTPEYSDIRLAGHEGGDFLFVRRD